MLSHIRPEMEFICCFAPHYVQNTHKNIHAWLLSGAPALSARHKDGSRHSIESNGMTQLFSADVTHWQTLFVTQCASIFPSLGHVKLIKRLSIRATNCRGKINYILFILLLSWRRVCILHSSNLSTEELRSLGAAASRWSKGDAKFKSESPNCFMAFFFLPLRVRLVV